MVFADVTVAWPLGSMLQVYYCFGYPLSYLAMKLFYFLSFGLALVRLQGRANTSDRAPSPSRNTVPGTPERPARQRSPSPPRAPRAAAHAHAPHQQPIRPLIPYAAVPPVQNAVPPAQNGVSAGHGRAPGHVAGPPNQGEPEIHAMFNTWASERPGQ